MQAVVDGLNFFDFFFFIVVDAQGEEMLKAFAVFFGSEFQRLQIQIGLLVVGNVAAMAFAEDFHVAVEVEDVVLQLEAHAHIDAEVVEMLDVGLIGISHGGTHLQGSGQQHGGLQSDHLQVLVDSHVAQGLKVEVHLLAFADFASYLTQLLRDFSPFLRL